MTAEHRCRVLPELWTDREREALQRIDLAVAEHSSPGREIVAVYGAFSGGHDSLVATAIAAKHPLFRGVLHVDTGIGIEETRAFVREICAAQGWELTVVRAKEDCDQDYERLVLEHGFPGPGHHYKMWQRLKERCLRYFFRHHVPFPKRAVPWP